MEPPVCTIQSNASVSEIVMDPGLDTNLLLIMFADESTVVTARDVTAL